MQVSNVFAGKHGFITPRDLFKWAGRGAVGYEQLAENGYLLLGERLRTMEDRALVRQVLERQMRIQVCFPHAQRAQHHVPAVLLWSVWHNKARALIILPVACAC